MRDKRYNCGASLRVIKSIDIQNIERFVLLLIAVRCGADCNIRNLKIVTPIYVTNANKYSVILKPSTTL